MTFYDIFSKITRKAKENKKKQKPLIIADIHEKNSLVLAELHSNKDIELAINPLEIGDYLIGKTVIERKTISDFISSMINKRLIEQLIQMQTYEQKLLIIEGEIKEIDNFKTPNAIRGMILSIINNFQTPVIFSKDYEETANYLSVLAKQQLKPKTEISLHSRIPKTIPEQKQYILEAFPNIGPVTAKKLLKEFKTLNKVFNASEEELNKILKNKAEDFKNLLSN